MTTHRAVYRRPEAGFGIEDVARGVGSVICEPGILASHECRNSRRQQTRTRSTSQLKPSRARSGDDVTTGLPLPNSAEAVEGGTWREACLLRLSLYKIQYGASIRPANWSVIPRPAIKSRRTQAYHLNPINRPRCSVTSSFSCPSLCSVLSLPLCMLVLRVRTL